MTNIPTHFRDGNYELTEYDGSPIEWRVSIYGIVIQDQKLLVIKSNEEKLFDIPGGGVEFGESLPEALKREGLEEAGHELKAIRPIWTIVDWFYHNSEKTFYRAVQMYWQAESLGEVGNPTDARYGKPTWAPLNELESLPIYPNVLTALESVANTKLLVQ